LNEGVLVITVNFAITDLGGAGMAVLGEVITVIADQIPVIAKRILTVF
jgi:hypothetical protein